MVHRHHGSVDDCLELMRSPTFHWQTRMVKLDLNRIRPSQPNALQAPSTTTPRRLNSTSNIHAPILKVPGQLTMRKHNPGLVRKRTPTSTLMAFQLSRHPRMQTRHHWKLVRHHQSEADVGARAVVVVDVVEEGAEALRLMCHKPAAWLEKIQTPRNLYRRLLLKVAAPLLHHLPRKAPREAAGEGGAEEGGVEVEVVGGEDEVVESASIKAIHQNHPTNRCLTLKRS